MWTKQKNKTGHTKRRRQKKSCKACTRTSSSVATLSIFWAFLHIFTQMKKVNTNFAHVDILSHVRIFQNIHKYSHTINYQYFFDPVSIPEMKRTCTNYARRRLSWKLFAQWLASKLMFFFVFRYSGAHWKTDRATLSRVQLNRSVFYVVPLAKARLHWSICQELVKLLQLERKQGWKFLHHT